MIKIKSAVILLLVFLSFNISRAESVEPSAETPPAVESQSGAGHELQAEGGEVPIEEHNEGIPLAYYLNWSGLAAMSIIVLLEIRKIKKESQHKEVKKSSEFYEAGSEKPEGLGHKVQKPVFIPVLLILMAGLIFFSEQLPALFGHVDIEKAKLISGFHENLAAGFLRFIFKILVGVLMLSYGLSSMEEEHH